MPMYQIKPLPLETIRALQNAIIQGAFAQPIGLMRAQIEANKDSWPIVDALMKDIGELQHAAQAVMDAAPHNEAPENFVRMVREMSPGGTLRDMKHFADDAARLAFIFELVKGVKL